MFGYFFLRAAWWLVIAASTPTAIVELDEWATLLPAGSKETKTAAQETRRDS
jgi:hypothetical protein